ncbi:acetolactate synthase, small subunit [Peptostreptococcaceae bacterium AS15]|jgi:acetolactate synthase, small subunit|nr:acetolactate synthase, small subunit [[Eubacterium] yurii subsp. margaretiae ATCC 43715]EJP26279.1 acetolactate synthase, small subunit [Peptostreptococcaceae bacterium AS15]RKW58314.1 MAG: acetolactate synthase small subunit [Lachnospiraceae bacterium]SKC63199.1 acetolactate synthase, small subunit [[Eubacterium] yurii]
MEGQKLEVLSIVVQNNYGVLARISSLFGRRGYNIDTLTVSNTDDPDISRITLTVQGFENEINQIILQTSKLEEVIKVDVLEQNKSVMREIVLAKIKTNADNRSKMVEVATIYKGSIIDLSPTSMIVEVTGKPTKINAFIKVLEDFEILEICRTGITAMSRDSDEMIIRKK